MLRGSLDDFSLEDILWLVGRADKTGELFINRPPGTGRFFFTSGKVDHIETDLLKGRVGPGGDARTVAEDAAFELLRRELGDFTWNPGVTSQSGVALSLSIEDILTASEQRAAELAYMRQLIPSDQSVVAVSSAPPENLEEVTVARAQWALLAHVDGRRTIEAISAAAGIGEFYVLRTLFPLAERRLIEVRAGAPENQDVAPAQVDLTNPADPGPAAPSAPTAFPTPDTT